MDSDFLKHICCSHSNHTDPDENGDAICFKCGLVIQVRFNMDRFIESINKFRWPDRT